MSKIEKFILKPDLFFKDMVGNFVGKRVRNPKLSDDFKVENVKELSKKKCEYRFITY